MSKRLSGENDADVTPDYLVSLTTAIARLRSDEVEILKRMGSSGLQEDRDAYHSLRKTIEAMEAELHAHSSRFFAFIKKIRQMLR